jgi:hypothetical protein
MYILDSLMTENEDNTIKTSFVTVEGAGSAEVNGRYEFHAFKHNAGVYKREGIFQNKPVNFLLYKCPVQNNGSQWFISITPEGNEPGTRHDIDFYYALPKRFDDLFPPINWAIMNNNINSKLPVPSVKVTIPNNIELPESLIIQDVVPIIPLDRPESDSEIEGSSAIADDMDDGYYNSPDMSPHNRSYG